MGIEHLGQLVLGFVFGVVVALAAAGLWMRARLKRLHLHQERVEQARQQSAQHMAQARKQIEQLQREAHELRMAVMRHGAKPPTEREAPPEPVVDPAEAARRYVESKLHPQAPATEPEAFPDTLVLRRSPKE